MKTNSARWGFRAGFCGMLSLFLSTGFAPPSTAGSGKACVGVPLPRAQLGPAGDVSGALRENVMTQLKGTGQDAVALDAGAPDQAAAEAKSKGCGFVLYTRVEQKHGGGSLFSKLAATQGAGQQQVVGQMTGDAQSGIKRGDTLALEYRLIPVGASAPLKADTLQGTADSDGQDLLNPMVVRLASAVSTATQGSLGAAAPPAGAPAAADSSAGHPSTLGSLFGHHNTANKSASPPTQEIDCAKVASMPDAIFSQASCEQMKASQQAYTQAASDPSAARPGDEQMSCDQILAELKQQQYATPDKAKAAEAKATATKERTMLASQTTEIIRDQVAAAGAVEAAAMADRATEMATMGVVSPNSAGAMAEAFAAKERAKGEAFNAERRPTEQKMTAQTADFGADAAKQLTANPRLARLTQLANSHHCHGG